MNNLFVVDVIEPLANLTDDGTAVSFFHSMSFSQHLEQLTSCCKFHQKVDVLLVSEVPVQRRNVAVR